MLLHLIYKASRDNLPHYPAKGIDTGARLHYVQKLIRHGELLLLRQSTAPIRHAFSIHSRLQLPPYLPNIKFPTRHSVTEVYLNQHMHNSVKSIQYELLTLFFNKIEHVGMEKVLKKLAEPHKRIYFHHRIIYVLLVEVFK